ncbi:hypothetical protein PF005_g20631 [Phytophthora fragariae]|uniref:Prephenate dehydratase domain-containing protein n=1 Tax=Phytophthora fragariae TaxID=53985 RepID=A0A6A3ZIV7_9STRA|nr:hypothetical protein PF003_g24406 [Phytophthora fragariae]KAE8928210.1 hypothetical protein PF009_g21642 [Phytophthora fragariae]KAE8983218.1 hypothetical protein PF011_g21283 [Phytophthora fragariae]KAE9108095.1 hypothetical protein PF006_g20954 [Phytophthora fragariae]KAE9115026.1 hypothetical protein PF010_g9505 [Phytophthora fragariae]
MFVAAPTARERPPSPHSPPRVEHNSSVVNVGYVGHRGTPAKIAARTMFPLLQIGPSTATTCIESLGFVHAVDAMDSLINLELDYCVEPTTWLLTIRPDFSLTAFTARPLSIVGEIALTLDLCLCALPGSALSACDCVMSDTALLHASEALIIKLEHERGGPIVRQAAWDSAGACHIVHEQAAHDIAVLASKDAARDAGLDVIAEHFGADVPNELQYLILARRHAWPLQPHADCPLRKVTLLASLYNNSAWLSAVTQALDDADAHVADIQTRLVMPSFDRAPEHQMLVTFVTAADAPPQRLQQRLRDLSTSLRMLGMYFSIACAS